MSERGRAAMRGPARRENIGGFVDFLLPAAMLGAGAGATLSALQSGGLLGLGAGATSAFSAFLIVFGLALLLTVSRGRRVLAIGWSAAIAALIAAGDYSVAQFEAAAPALGPDARGFWRLAGPACAFIALLYAKTGFDWKPMRWPYPFFFANALNFPLHLVGATLLTLVTLAFAVAWGLAAETFADNGSLAARLSELGILLIAVGAGAGFFIAFSRLQPQSFAALRYFVVSAARALLFLPPLIAAVIAAAIAALGWERVVEAANAGWSAPAVALALAAATTFLLICAYDEADTRRPPRSLTAGFALSVFALTAFVGLGAYALWARVSEAGVTAHDTPAVAGIVIFGAYALGALISLASLVGAWMRWLPPIRYLNRVWPAFAFAVLYAPHLPGLNIEIAARAAQAALDLVSGF